MKARLEFDLPEDDWAFEAALKGADFRSALNEIREKIRTWRKYEDRQSVPIKEIEEMFWEAVEDVPEVCICGKFDWDNYNQ